jgi:hypothetical protein
MTLYFDRQFKRLVSEDTEFECRKQIMLAYETWARGCVLIVTPGFGDKLRAAGVLRGYRVER